MTKVYTVYDSKTEAYLQPFFMASNGAALRAFIDAVNDPASAFGKHPEDFTLFELGTWDESTASLAMLATPVSLGVAITFLKPL